MAIKVIAQRREVKLGKNPGMKFVMRPDLSKVKQNGTDKLRVLPVLFFKNYVKYSFIVGDS